VLDGIELVKAGHAQEAISGYFDKVIASYQKRYAADKRHIYCGHDQAETLLYLVQSANNGEDAVALTPMWADAWYHKSYALTELHRDAEALSALDKANRAVTQPCTLPIRAGISLSSREGLAAFPGDVQGRRGGSEADLRSAGPDRRAHARPSAVRATP